MSVDLDGLTSAIGDSLLTRAPLSTEHPIYRSIVARTSEKLSAISKREDARYRGKTKIICFESLDPEDSESLRNTFPEFTLVDFGTSRPGHSLLASLVNLSSEWCIAQCTRMTSKFAHVGGVSVNHVLAGRRGVLLIGDSGDSNFVHRKHENTLNLVRLARESGTITQLLGRPVDLELIVDALKGVAYGTNKGFMVKQQCDGLVYDGLTCALGPKQVAGAMAELGAKVCYGFFPFTPDMLVSDAGEFWKTGVRFERQTRAGVDYIRFIQSEGNVINQEIPLALWSQWISGHTIKIKWGGKRFYYQYELMMNRGCVMFFKMTWLSKRPKFFTIMHALELPFNADLYVVNSWRVKSLVSDVNVSKNWVPITFTVDKRLIDRVYAFGMQLDKTQFTRFALRKQLKVVNDRVVVAGTGVEWHAPLSPEQLDDLSVALFAKLFVDRYDAGNLSSMLMAQLKQMTSFNSASAIDKLRVVAGLSLNGVWDMTIGVVDEAIRRICDKINCLMSNGKMNPEINISRAPTYVLMTEVGGSWLHRFTRYMNLDTDNWLPGFDKNFPGYVSGAVCSPALKVLPKDDHDRAVSTKVPGSLLIGHADIPEEDLFDRPATVLKLEIAGLMEALNEMDCEPVDRFVDLSLPIRRLDPIIPSKPDFEVVSDPIETLNTVYGGVFKGNQLVDSEYDVASNVYDPQNRNFSVKRLIAAHCGLGPKTKKYYASRIKAINVPKRQETLSELLSATAARNMDPPVLSKPQDFKTLIPAIWENFLKRACVDEAPALLAKFQDDVTALGAGALRDWMDKAKDENTLANLRTNIANTMNALAEYDVGKYVAMNKADVKVPLSDKLQHERIEPQVIVYHDKVLSAGFSAIFRVMVSRFLQLLRPNVHINLRKNVDDIAGFVNANHPFFEVNEGVKPIYLENDFSKYDKSQMQLAFELEKFVFEKLGMSAEFVNQWYHGHVDCNIKSFIHSFSLQVSWQRKSGDATTAFGNVLLNSMSVLFSYPISEYYWAVFMGDDSLICAKQIGVYDDAVKTLAEVFNLQAKTYQTDAPYYASNFVVINQDEMTVGLLPDPIKRIEKWSMSVAEEDGAWADKYESAKDVCKFYNYKMYTSPLARLVVQRYPGLTLDAAERSCDAIATLIQSEQIYRTIWEDNVSTFIA